MTQETTSFDHDVRSVAKFPLTEFRGVFPMGLLPVCVDGKLSSEVMLRDQQKHGQGQIVGAEHGLGEVARPLASGTVFRDASLPPKKLLGAIAVAAAKAVIRW